jgi:serine/threonine protein kinase
MFVCPDCGHSQPVAGACPNDQTALAPRGDDFLIGQQVGAYRIAKLLGVGGMGRVYKGVHPSIGSRVAVKVLSRECADRPDLVERFFSEARAVNMIRHESIVNVLDLAQLPDGRPYIIMEYLDGAPLSDIVGKRGPLPLGGLARLIAEVLDALAAAHAKGIVHRDLKPDNIYVTPAGRPKVLDFGIAKLRPEMGGSSTQTGSLLGTPHYMSPEQALGKPVDLRTDIYAMGVILFECACGRRPFVAESLFDLLRKHVDEPPPPPRSLRPDMPPALEQVIMYALAKDPNHRFQSCVDLANALMQATQGLPPDQWSAITPSGSSRMAGQPSPSWGSQNTWPQSHPPGLTPPPSHPPTHPQSHPPSHVPTPPPPGSFAAGQVAQQQPRKSNTGLIIGLVGLALVGGGVATAVVLTQGGSDSNGTAAGTASASASGSVVATGSATGTAVATGSAAADEDEDDVDEARLEALEAQVEALDDNQIAKVVRTPPAGGGGGGGGGTSSDAFKKKLAAFSSGVPQCDAYVRAFIELIDCPQMAQYHDQYMQSAEQLMQGFASFKNMDANTRKQLAASAGQSCQQGADAMKQAAAAMGCKISGGGSSGGGGGGGGGATPPAPSTPPPPDPDIRRDGPYNLTIAGFNAKGWDYMKWLPTALAEAKKHFPDAQIARIDAEGVGPDGLVHFDVSSDWEVLYRFTSPSASKKPASHPAGVKWEPTCMVQIFVKPGDVTVIPMKGFGCEPPVPMPKCTAKQIWQKAVAKGAPASNAYAELWYGYAGGKWSFDIDEVFDDSFTDGC